MCDYCNQLVLIVGALLRWDITKKNSCQECFDKARKEAVYEIKQM